MALITADLHVSDLKARKHPRANVTTSCQAAPCQQHHQEFHLVTARVNTQRSHPAMAMRGDDLA